MYQFFSDIKSVLNNKKINLVTKVEFAGVLISGLWMMLGILLIIVFQIATYPNDISNYFTESERTWLGLAVISPLPVLGFWISIRELLKGGLWKR